MDEDFNEKEDIYKIDSVIGPDGKRDWDLLRKQVYKKYSKEDMQDQLISFVDNNLDLTVLNDSGKSLSKLCITFFREEQYKAKNARAMYSPDEVLQSDELLEKAFEKIDSKPDYYAAGSDYKNFISFITNEATMVSKVAIFSPNLARKIYERWCPKFYGNVHDSSCVDEDTEYFNGIEWKKISEYKEGEKVLQYNADHSSSLITPIRYIHYKDKTKPFYHFTSYNTDQMLTGDHKVVAVPRVNGTATLDYNTLYKMSVEDYLNSSSKIKRTRIPTTVSGIDYIPGIFNLSELQIRFIVACQADVRIAKPYITTSDKHYFKTNPFYSKGTIRYYKSRAKFSKQHKIERFRWLLDSLEIPYVESTVPYKSSKHKDQTSFEFIAPKWVYETLNDKKDFPTSWLYTMPQDLKEVFIDEVMKWDAHDGTYINTNKHNADFVFNMLLTSDIMPKISVDTRLGLKPCYYVSANQTKSCSLFNEHSYNIVYKEDKYCFTVPSGMLVLRRNGIPFVTGNCGWGNRCQGAMTSKFCYNYYGTDPNSTLHKCYEEQADFIRETLHTNNITDFRCCGSEEFIPEWEGKMDISFTSPPYFNTEKYSNELTQSAAKCLNYYAWRDEFMRPTIKNVYRYLKPGAYYLLNLKNLTPTFGSFPALNDWAIVAQQEGFIWEDVEVMHYQSTRQFGVSKKTGKKREVKFTGDKEPVLVLRKPREGEKNTTIRMIKPNTIDKSWENRNKRGHRK